jgi:Reverse transcriptase (RNA-dependent DNA polymerase)
MFKKELQQLVAIGVLEEAGRLTWVAPTFIIPKKGGTVRWVSDFRSLNKVIKRKIYPLTKNGDILARRTGYQFFSKIDVSMQYYTFKLDKESAKLCTIATPFGLYQYRRLPMGVNQSPDIAQEIIEKVLRGINDIKNYLDDIGCFSETWEAHLQLLDTVLHWLEVNGFTVNPSKCKWAAKKTDWLGHWLTRKLKRFSGCNRRKMFSKCDRSWDRYSILETCGQSELTFLSL